MKVENVMTTDVGVCGLEDNLTKAVAVMRDKDCGVVPVVDAENRLVGVVTDRDVCLALGSRRLSGVKAGEIINGESIVACAPDEKITSALKKMRKHQLKRLPVVGQNGEVVGILSVTDVLRTVRGDKKLKKQTYRTLRRIFEPRPIVLQEIAASEAVETDGGE